ncbi:MAG: hypothetical protein GX597_14775 [Anaerolineaceae bacterium]|nr:hypothetical protein [Anaerolineaceae bacterium]
MRPLYGLRPWSTATAVILLLSVIAISSAPAFAQSGNVTSSVIPSNTMPDVGEQITATISIDVAGVDPPDNALGSFTATLDWNPTVLEYDGNSGILAGFSGIINDTQVSSGHLVFNGVKVTGSTGSFAVLEVTFDVVGSGSSELNLEFSAMSSAYTFKNLLPLLTVYDGSVQVGPSQNYSLSIAVQPPEGGITDPEAGVHSYAEGTVVNVTVVPNASYEFDHWDGACTGSGACQVTMDADKAVTAVLTELPLTCYALTLSHTGHGSDPVAAPTNSPGCPAGRYVEGETIALSGAIPDPGWRIGGWIGTSADGSTADTNSLIIPASAHTVGVIYKRSIYLPICLREPTASERDLGEAIIQEDTSQEDARFKTPAPSSEVAAAGGSAPTPAPTTTEEDEGVLVEPPIASVASATPPAVPAVADSHSHSPGSWQQTPEEQTLMPGTGQSGRSDFSPVSRRIPIIGAFGDLEPVSWGLGLVCLTVPLAALVLSTLLLIRHKSVGG